MEIIILKTEALSGNVEYKATFIEDYHTALSRKITADQIKVDWFDPWAPTNIGDVDVTLSNGFTFKTSQLIPDNDRLLIIDKRSIEFEKICLAKYSRDLNVGKLRSAILEKYPAAKVYTNDLPLDLHDIHTSTKSFVRIPKPERTDIFVLPISELYRLSNFKEMTMVDYIKIKDLIQSPDLETRRLGIIATTKWHPVLSFEYLIILAHIEKDLIIQEFFNLGIEDMLSLTHSCGSNYPRPCSKCFNCRERIWAYNTIGKPVNLGQ
jgi:hypothetical protein